MDWARERLVELVRELVDPPAETECDEIAKEFAASVSRLRLAMAALRTALAAITGADQARRTVERLVGRLPRWLVRWADQPMATMAHLELVRLAEEGLLFEDDTAKMPPYEVAGETVRPRGESIRMLGTILEDLGIAYRMLMEAESRLRYECTGKRFTCSELWNHYNTLLEEARKMVPRRGVLAALGRLAKEEPEKFKTWLELRARARLLRRLFISCVFERLLGRR